MARDESPRNVVVKDSFSLSWALPNNKKMNNSPAVDIAYLGVQLERVVKSLDSLEGDIKYLSSMISRLEGKSSAVRHEIRTIKMRLGVIESEVT